MEAWKQEMKKLKQAYMLRTVPEFYAASGGDTMVLRSYSDKTVTALSIAVLDFLKFNGFTASRSKAKGKMMISGKICSRIISIEVQPGSEFLSGAQCAEKLRIEGAGGLYYVAGNMPGFLEWFEKIARPQAMKPL